MDYDDLIQGWPFMDREGLVAFLQSVLDEVDPFYDRRNKTMMLTNMWRDENSAARVTDFILERAGL